MDGTVEPGVHVTRTFLFFFLHEVMKCSVHLWEPLMIFNSVTQNKTSIVVCCFPSSSLHSALYHSHFFLCIFENCSENYPVLKYRVFLMTL